MTKRQAKPYGERVKQLMAEKSRLLSKAQAFADMGLEETAPARMVLRGVLRRAHRAASRCDRP